MVKPLAVNKSENTEGTFESWWNWLTSWGSAQANEIESVDESGNVVETETIEPAQTNKTTDNGILRLPLPDTSADRTNMLIAKRGNDVAFLPENSDYYWQQNGNWYKKGESSSLRWFVFDDRKMYRPKEEVAVKGYIRIWESGKLGDIQALGNTTKRFKLFRQRCAKQRDRKRNGELNAFGAFDFKFKIPDNANLGYSRIEIYSTDSNLRKFILVIVSRFRNFDDRNLKFLQRSKPKHRILSATDAKVAVEAKYYAGGGLANADVNWNVNRDADKLHAAEPGRIHFRNLDTVVVSRLRRILRRKLEEFQRT